MPVDVKICGLSTADTVDAAVDAGAAYVGFMFYEPSPRNISIEEARVLAERIRGRSEIVAVTVDADNALLSRIIDGLRPNFIQMHGSEPPDRVRHVQTSLGVKVLKAISVDGPDDVGSARTYEMAEMLLFDTKAKRETELPGGRGEAFDWRLMDAYEGARPWLLAGGLTAHTLKEAVETSGAKGVDVSSGVERLPGEKDPDLIRRFLRAANSL